MPSVERMADAVAPYARISDKIRALDAIGAPRAEIARFLKRSYQQVRGVLEGDRLRSPKAASSIERPVSEGQPPAAGPSPDSQETYFKLAVGADGAIVPPEAVRKAFGWRPGGLIVARLEDDVLVLESPAASVRRVQAYFRPLIPDGTSLVDELIAERRAEARRDAEGG